MRPSWKVQQAENGAYEQLAFPLNGSNGHVSDLSWSLAEVTPMYRPPPPRWKPIEKHQPEPVTQTCVCLDRDDNHRPWPIAHEWTMRSGKVRTAYTCLKCGRATSRPAVAKEPDDAHDRFLQSLMAEGPNGAGGHRGARRRRPAVATGRYPMLAAAASNADGGRYA